MLIISQQLFAQSSTDTILLAEEEHAWITAHPVLKASSNIALAPFDFMSAGEPAFIGTITDITEIKNAEQKTKKALAVKSDFLAAMSHDLRTPLNAIIGFSESLKLELFGPINNQKNSEYIKYISASGKYLLRLVNDILDISALETGKRGLNYENIDIVEIILECKSVVNKLAEDKNINLIVNIPEDILPVYADRKSLMQILMNLISNSIKFTPDNGSTKITVEVTDHDYSIQITDTGCGISEKGLKSITEPFKRILYRLW